MANEIEIRVTATDATGNAISSAKDKVRGLAHSVGESMTKVKNSAMGTFTKLGKEAGEALTTGVSKGFQGLASTIGTNPYILGIGLAVAAVLTPVIIAAMGSAILAGLGGGVIAAGIAAAMQDQKVSAAFDNLKKKASNTFKEFGTSFREPLTNVFKAFESGLDRLAPAFTRIGALMSPIVQKLGDGLMGMAEKAMPGIESALQASAPLLEKLAEHLPKLGESIGDFFDSIASGGPGLVKFFDHFLSAVEFQIEAIGNLIEGVGLFYDAITPGSAKVKDAAKGIEGMAMSTTGMERAASDAAAAIGSLNDALIDAGLVALSTRDAQRRLVESVANVSKAVKDNGKTLDINTEKGRANQTALDAVSRAALGVAKSLQQAHAPQSKISAAMQTGADKAFEQARKLGMSSQAAMAYTKSIFGIPPSRTTLVAALGAAKAAAEVAYLKRELQALRDRDIIVNYTTRRYVQDYGREATGGRRGGFAHGGNVGAAASGGIRSNMVWVGEQGPELVDLAPGSRVHSTGDSRRMAGEQGGGGASQIFYVTIHAGSEPGQVVQALQRYAQQNNGVRLRGGVKTI